MTVSEDLIRRFNPEALQNFYRACIGELTDQDADDSESVGTFYEANVARLLTEKARGLDCQNFRELVTPVDDGSVDQKLSGLMRPYARDWEKYSLPKSAADMTDQNLIGLLVFPGEVGFISADLDIQMWSFGEDLYAQTPENRIVNLNPLITYDLYGNVNGYSAGGLVCIFEGLGGDWWSDPEEWIS